jgi:tetratricopeptide (TPR) repeat protein
MPAMAAPEVGSASDAPLLALPDHTVAVDLGTPWEEEAGSGSSSNKMVYAVLTTVVLGLVGFFGYTHYQNQALKKPSSPTSSSSPISSALTLGEDSLKKAKAAFKQKKWAEAVGHADTAQLLIKDLKTAPKERVKEVVKFHRDANLRYASVTFDQANRALQSGDTNQALGLADKANGIYRKLSGTTRDQAKAYAFQGKVYERIGDLVNAQSAYKKAAGLSPGSGYEQQASAMRQSQVTEVVQQSAPAPSQEAAPEPQFIQPSLGDDSSVPTGRSGGGYRSSGGSAPAADAAPSAPAVRRPQNTYVPPKRDNTPSWRKKPKDTLPGY